MSVKNLLKQITYQFKNEKILKYALLHSSVTSSKEFERLEFLGDRVLNLSISEYLFKKFTNESEGQLNNRLSYSINKESLLIIAQKIELSKYLKYHRESITRHNHSILCDGMEALIGAIYLDSNDLSIVKNIIYKLWQDIILTKHINYKTELQEYMHKYNLGTLQYIVKRVDGPDHNAVFEIELQIKEKMFRATGKSKKLAEKLVAEKAFKYLNS